MASASAAFVAAGGYLHLEQWLDGYRDVPAAVPGSVLVRIGFPANALVSLALAVGLVLLARHRTRARLVVVGAAIAAQVASLAFLIGSRTGSVLGWTEPVWTEAAEEIRAVEAGALVALLALAALVALPRPQAARVTARR